MGLAVPKQRGEEAAVVDLGRRLFFDPRLSASNAMSCATCHNPSLGWTDGLPKARGAGNEAKRRNTPTILNARFHQSFTWNGATASLEDQALMPFQNADELNLTEKQIAEKLNRIPGYVTEFLNIFGPEGITLKNIVRSIAAFESTLVSYEETPLHQFRKDSRALSPRQQKGLVLFAGKARCVLCHTGPLLSDGGFHNLGVKTPDLGRYELTPVPAAKGAFRTPSLLEIGRTAPYMHDGGIATLKEVVDFYDRGGDDKENIDPLMQPLNLTPDEKADLVFFMAALTSPPKPFAVPALPQKEPPKEITDVMYSNVMRLKNMEENVRAARWESARLHALGLRDNVESVRLFTPAGADRDRMFNDFLDDMDAKAADLTRDFESAAPSPEALAAKIKDLKVSCNKCHAAFRPKGLVKFK